MFDRAISFSALTSAVSLALVSPLTLAAGYALNEQSASAMGVANAGAEANPENATILYFNPAGLTHLDRAQVSGGLAIIDVSSDFEGTATNTIGNPVSGADGGDLVDPTVIPNLYFSTPIDDQWSAGIGLFAPFGVAGNYDNDFVGRFLADETELKVLALQPTIAYQFNPQWSVGLGVNFVHAEGTLTKFQDFSSFTLPPANIPSAFLREGFSDVTGDDNGWGWTLGLMYQPGPSTTLGFSYRSKIDLELEGEAELFNVPRATGGIPPLTYATLEEDARLPLDLPESVRLGFKQGFGEQWTLHGGATWTRWSRFENLDIFTDQEGGGPISQLGGAKYQQAGIITHVPERWENTLALAIGVAYACTPEFTIKAGYAFDESPIQKEFRTARIPSTDRNWLTLGAQYKVEGGWVLDGTVGYLFIDDVDVNEYEYTVDGQRIGASNLQGTYKLSAYNVAFQLTKQF